jgi:serine/threonine protein kinase
VTRYELLDRIGVGGMAEIFRGKAVAAGGFEKPVAIKRIRPQLSSDRRFVELLIAEAKVLSLLKHRNIVQIFDVGLGDDGQYFLVMEFVDGKDIGAVQRALEASRRRMPVELVLHIGAEVCEALEHAHTARAPDGKQMALVHRDVSPSNVLLSRAGEVKLTDFGIAKRAEQDVTHGGAVRGKFAYISPEQARNEPLDPRADVFSIGILLWELICNRRLFSQLDDLAALREVREAEVPRPTQIDPRLTPEIDNLLLGALAKDKERRYPSAGAFGAKLRALRYSLESSGGDPSTELARIIDTVEAAERATLPVVPAMPSGPHGVEPSEATVIRIQTAHEFSAVDNDQSILKARAVIDRFEEEETRQARLPGEQLRLLRHAVPVRRDSAELTVEAPMRDANAPAPARSRRDSNEATRARSPIVPDAFSSPSDAFTNEKTKLVPPRDRRTPDAQRTVRPPTLPPPLPAPIAPQRPPRDATPTTQDLFERPVYPVRPSQPKVAGFGAPHDQRGFLIWLLVVGSVVLAMLAFLVTRLFLR